MRASTPGFSLRQAYHKGLLSQYLLLIACVAGVVGLFAARALVALSPVAGLLAAIANPEWRLALAGWRRSQTVLFMALLYSLLLIGGLYTTQWDVWWHEVYRELPLIGVPLAFAVAVPLTGRQRFGIGCFFVLGAAGMSLVNLVRYLLDPADANERIGIGQNMQTITGVFHIHFGIMLALAFYFSLRLWRSPYATRLWQALLLAAAASIVLVLHVLAYRTGLLAFYTALLFRGLQLLTKRRHFGLGLLLLLAASGLAWGAYHWLEPIQLRVNATRYDVEQFRLAHDINTFSLARRLAAWETALVVIGENPWLGVSPADAEAAMMNQYDWRDYGLLPANRIMIHNQYLHYLVSSGIVGLFVWLLALLGPLVQPKVRRNPYVIHFLLIMGVTMLVDSLLQLQIGFNLFVFLYSFLLVDEERRAQTDTRWSGEHLS